MSRSFDLSFESRKCFAFAFEGSNQYETLMNVAEFHSTVMLPCCVLQHQSISVHRALLSRVVPGVRPYEDGMCVDIGVAAL